MSFEILGGSEAAWEPEALITSTVVFAVAGASGEPMTMVASKNIAPTPVIVPD